MQPESFKFVHVSIRQKTEKAARVRVWPNPKGPPTSTTPLEVWLPFSQCSPNLMEAPRGQTLTVGVQDWLIPNKGLEKYLTSGPATELLKPKKTAWEEETPAELVAAAAQAVAGVFKFADDDVETQDESIASVTAPWKPLPSLPGGDKPLGVKHNKTRKEAAVEAFYLAKSIAPESGQEPPDYDPLDDLL